MLYRKSFRTKKHTDTKQITFSLIILSILFIILFVKGLPTQEEMECLQWKVAEYPYYANWQIDQCLHYNVKLK